MTKPEVTAPRLPRRPALFPRRVLFPALGAIDDPEPIVDQ